MIETRGLRLDGGTPVIGARGAGYCVFPVDLAVGQRDLDQLGEVRLRRILAVGHLAVDVDYGGVSQHCGEEVLLFALNGGAIPLQGHFRQHFARGQGVVHQRYGLVQSDGELERLVDALTGRLTGLRIGRYCDNVLELLDQHLVFVALNKAVPLMYNSLASGEMLPKVTLKWYRTSVEGKQEHFFSTVLTDATIVDIDCQMPHCQDPANADFTQLIQVSLAYRKIDWEHTVAGTSGADDWRAPIEA